MNIVSFVNVDPVFRNFAGEERQYNRFGDRNFGIVIDEQTAKNLERNGWRIRWMKPKVGAKIPYLFIKVMPNEAIPEITLRSNGNEAILALEEWNTLDYLPIRIVKMTVHAKAWQFQGKEGITALLDTLIVTTDKE